MIFYHGTNQRAWENIQKEGILFGRRMVLEESEILISKYKVFPCTYLTPKHERSETLWRGSSRG